MKVTDRHRFEFHNACDQYIKAAADECLRDVKLIGVHSLERGSLLGSHFTFEGGGDRKITKENKFTRRVELENDGKITHKEPKNALLI